MTLQPIGVAKADVTLSQFVPTDGEDGWMYNMDYIATIKPNGAFDKKYGYLSTYWAGPDGFEDPDLKGWWDFTVVNKDFEVPEEQIISRNNEKIPFGTGVAVYTSMAGVTVTFAGEVLADDYGIPLSFNANTFTGIVCPADVKLGDLEPTDGEDGWMYNMDYLATIKPNGAFDKKYGYLSPYWAGPDGFEDPDLKGWWDFTVVNKDFEVPEEQIISRDGVELKAGQGLAVYTSMAGVELVVPSALP